MIQSKLSLFYAKTLGDVLEQSPLWDRNLYVSLCIEVLTSQGHTEPVIAVAIACIVIEIERTSVAITIIAPAYEEWIARIREVRVGSV